MAIARVAMPIAAWQLFDYWIPDGLAIARGEVVRAHLGSRRRIGVVIAIDPHSEFGDRVQPIEAMADVPRLPDEIMALAQFVSDYYQAPPGLAYALATPPLAARRKPSSPTPVPRASREGPAPHALNDAQRRALATIGAAAQIGRAHV